ncbi:MAG TPA: hypothetical protein VJ085_04895 [Candidatus Acidoferrales bacterium]|nr:hypothetical protein [Candidatus Acidoferrales bacterium]
MVRKGILLLLAVVGLVTFFLPLVRVQAPIVGTQRISGWDALRQAQEKKSRSNLDLEQTLDRLQADILRQKRRQPPLAVRQADALRVTLPLAYLSLLLAGVFMVWGKNRPLQVTAGVGLLAGAYSLLSVFWLSSGVKEMVADSEGRTVLGIVRRSVARQVDVSPELGLYLLAGALAALVLASPLLPARR